MARFFFSNLFFSLILFMFLMYVPKIFSGGFFFQRKEEDSHQPKRCDVVCFLIIQRTVICVAIDWNWTGDNWFLIFNKFHIYKLNPKEKERKITNPNDNSDILTILFERKEQGIRRKCYIEDHDRSKIHFSIRFEYIDLLARKHY